MFCVLGDNYGGRSPHSASFEGVTTIVHAISARCVTLVLSRDQTLVMGCHQLGVMVSKIGAHMYVSLFRR